MLAAMQARSLDIEILHNREVGQESYSSESSLIRSFILAFLALAALRRQSMPNKLLEVTAL
jgi:hypothetical protein